MFECFPLYYRDLEISVSLINFIPNLCSLMLMMQIFPTYNNLRFLSTVYINCLTVKDSLNTATTVS